jgi:hypothetical protein
LEKTMRQLTIASVSLLLLGSLLTTAGATDIYRWKDAKGSWHYADQPVPGAERISGIARPPSAQSSSTTPVSRSTTNPSSGAGSDSLPVSNSVSKQVQADVAKARTEQCDKAKEAYTKTVQARRMYKTDEKGVRTFLSDAEITTAQIQAGAQRDLACSR